MEVDRTIEKPIYMDKIVPVEVFVDRPVETIKEVIVEKPIHHHQIIEVEKIVDRPVEIIKYVEIEVPVYEDRIVEVEKLVEVPIERHSVHRSVDEKIVERTII